MAIYLEFIDLVVPIERIREKYPGGMEACLRDHAQFIGGRVWYDEFLFRDGAMDPGSAGALVDSWEQRGFQPFTERHGVRCWNDVCIVEGIFGGPSLPCDWIDVDLRERIAYLRGHEPGAVVGPRRLKAGTVAGPAKQPPGRPSRGGS